MNITLSVPQEIAAKAKLVAARRGETLSLAWDREYYRVYFSGLVLVEPTSKR